MNFSYIQKIALIALIFFLFGIFFRKPIISGLAIIIPFLSFLIFQLFHGIILGRKGMDWNWKLKVIIYRKENPIIYWLVFITEVLVFIFFVQGIINFISKKS